MENVSFACEIVRDSPMVNFDSQTVNKQIHQNAPWSSAAKFMLPGNAKCSMTSLADTKQSDLFMNPRFRSWLRPHAVSRLRARFARDKIIKSLRSE